jgi:hypothetical protein
MKRKLIICARLIVFSTFLFAKLALAEKASDNAATYYNRAFELCTYTYKSSIGEKVLEVAKNGWVEEDKKLEKLLKKNEPAIAEFEKGIKLQKCDFAFGETHDNPYTEPVANLLKTQALAHLILLKGRLVERNGDYSRAIEQYLSALTFAEHISQNKLLISVMVTSAIQVLTLRPLQQYLENEQADSKICKQILTFLQKISSKKGTLVEAMAREREGFNWSGRLCITGWQNKIAEDAGKLNKDKMQKTEIFINSLSESFKAVADKYYGALIQFAKTNSAADKQHFENEISYLTNKYPTEDKALEKVTQFESSLLKDPDSRTEETANTLAGLLAAIALPNLAPAMEHYYLPEAKFRALLAAAAIRVYAAEKGRFPDTLSDLVPEYLASIPIDPWSQDVLKYVKTKDKILIYSFGPDRTDNSGAGTGYETSKELEGKDLIFSLLLDSD